MKNIFGLLALLGLLINFSACSDDTDDTLPACHDQLVEDFRQIACPGSGDLTTWTFRDRLVYCYATGSCISEPYADIYDADCNLVCKLGGPNGLSTCEGLDWNQEARRESTILTF